MKLKYSELHSLQCNCVGVETNCDIYRFCICVNYVFYCAHLIFTVPLSLFKQEHKHTAVFIVEEAELINLSFFVLTIPKLNYKDGVS